MHIQVVTLLAYVRPNWPTVRLGLITVTNTILIVKFERDVPTCRGVASSTLMVFLLLRDVATGIPPSTAPTAPGASDVPWDSEET